MDESLLPPPEAPARPFPWRAALALLVPAAALAAGTGLQRWLEGPQPAGDAALRWLFWSAGCGALVGAGVGLARRARISWTLYGLAAPFAAAGLALAGVRAALPLRESIADRREAACRAEGRKLCTLGEFESACARRDLPLLGAAEQSLKDGTARWYYRGPFRPEQMRVRGAVLCSITADARAKMMAVAEP